MAKIFAKKFDIISPVWLQIVKQGDAYAVAGTHDIDAGWLTDVRRKGKVQQQPQMRTVKSKAHTPCVYRQPLKCFLLSVFPRIIFDHFTDRDIKLLLSDAEERTKLNDMLIKTCKEHGFDGLVLEVWSQLAGRIDDKILYAMVLQMGTMASVDMILFMLNPCLRIYSQGAAETAAAPHLGDTAATQRHSKFVWRKAFG